MRRSEFDSSRRHQFDSSIRHCDSGFAAPLEAAGPRRCPSPAARGTRRADQRAVTTQFSRKRNESAPYDR